MSRVERFAEGPPRDAAESTGGRAFDQRHQARGERWLCWVAKLQGVFYFVTGVLAHPSLAQLLRRDRAEDLVLVGPNVWGGPGDCWNCAFPGREAPSGLGGGLPGRCRHGGDSGSL